MLRSDAAAAAEVAAARPSARRACRCRGVRVGNQLSAAAAVAGKISKFSRRSATLSIVLG